MDRGRPKSTCHCVPRTVDAGMASYRNALTFGMWLQWIKSNEETNFSFEKRFVFLTWGVNTLLRSHNMCKIKFLDYRDSKRQWSNFKLLSSNQSQKIVYRWSGARSVCPSLNTTDAVRDDYSYFIEYSRIFQGINSTPCSSNLMNYFHLMFKWMILKEKMPN